MSQLTRLDLDWRLPPADLSSPDPNQLGFDVADLAQLGRLTGLESLTVKAPSINTKMPNSGLQFLSQLSALTALTLGLQLRKICNADSFGGCNKLSCLVLPVSARMLRYYGQLGVAPCAAIPQLTGLTKLLVGWKLSDSAVPEFYRALKQLPQLQEVGTHMWTPEVLPVLAGLKQLYSIEGGWDGASSGSNGSSGVDASSRCVQVQQLVGVAGHVPFQAFAIIEWCSLAGSIAPVCLTDIHTQCTKLEVIDIEGCSAEWRVPVWPCLDARAVLSVRLAALASLAKLPALHTFSWNVNDSAEVQALATGMTSLASLAVLQSCRNAPYIFGRYDLPTILYSHVWALSRLPQLQQLVLVLPGFNLSVKQARQLLSGSAALQHMHVMCTSRWKDIEALQRAYSEGFGHVDVHLRVRSLDGYKRSDFDGPTGDDGGPRLSDGDSSELSTDNSDDFDYAYELPWWPWRRPWY